VTHFGEGVSEVRGSC